MSHEAHKCSSHVHSHDHTSGIDDSARLLIALLIIAAFAVIEVVGALLSGSLALLADAGHMVTDGTAIGLALVARRLACREPTKQFTFGQHRAQVLAAFVNGLALFALIIFLLFESIERITNPQDIDVKVMMSVAVLGLLANFAAFAVLHGGSSNDVNMRGALLHVIGDILGSVAAIASAVVIATTGFLPADPLVTLFVCVLIGKSAWQLIKETGLVLLEGAPDHLDYDELRQEVMSLPHVVAVEDLKMWMLTPEKTQIIMRVRVDEPVHGHDTLRAMERILSDMFGIEHSTIQIEIAATAKRPEDGPKTSLNDPDVVGSAFSSQVHPGTSSIH